MRYIRCTIGWSTSGGRRRLAAALLTLISLLIVIGPATWLVLGLIEVSECFPAFRSSALVLPPPPEAIKGWPLVGEPIYQFWDLASTNLHEALAKIAPHLKPVGSGLFQIATGAGTGMITFFIAIVIAGFLFSPAPWLGGGDHEVSRAGSHGPWRRIR